MPMSAELAVMLSPSREYQGLAERREAGTWPRALGGPAFFALVLGCVLSIGTTGVITPSLLVSAMICWSFVPILQVLNGLVLIRGGVRDRRRALELLFLGHAPWSLWVLAFAAVVSGSPHSQLIALATIIAPALWTWRILTAFCREILGLPASAARRRVMVHGLITLALVLVYAQLTAGLVSRALADLVP
jgi:hypothetical protein